MTNIKGRQFMMIMVFHMMIMKIMIIRIMMMNTLRIQLPRPSEINENELIRYNEKESR